ncbi:MAG: hypothetical protein HOO12_02335 [Methylococcales bacterium]|jgi:hypothetical protein|nr:hypothetical protein [Methylococcales bacterium]MBT6250866.1 hypothetical protein [Nitrosomonadales bacterium]MBT3815060.1 hypothetical protein [Methylococcales bacterium]MBT4032201.1 hypothetical protein [Methylococcales bacterium]MBT4347264.1 hypothetical protein [Methylococcales bacterium]
MNFIKIFFFTLFFTPFAANAATAIDQSLLLGDWTVNWEANNSSGQAANKGSAIETTWTFTPNGTLASRSIDYDPNTRMRDFAATLKYRVEDGKLIKQVAPGRSTEDSCSAFKMEGANLILKCRFRYYSLTKK